jgi:hypothetical protein
LTAGDATRMLASTRAMPAVLKNLLEWTIGDAGTYGKPVAWLNVSSAAAQHQHGPERARRSR